MEPQASSTELQRQTLPVLQEAAADATLEEATSAAGKALKQLLSALAVMFLIAVCATARYSWAAASKARQLLGEASVMAREEEIVDLEQPAEKCQQGEQPAEEIKSQETPGETLWEAWQEMQKQEEQFAEQFAEQPAEKESEYSAPQRLAPENCLVRYRHQLEVREMEIVQQERQLYAQAQDIMQRVQEVQQEKDSIERQQQQQQQTGPRTKLPRQSALSSGPGPEVAAMPTPGRSRRVPQRPKGKHSPADSELSIGRSEGSVGSSSAPRWRF